MKMLFFLKTLKCSKHSADYSLCPQTCQKRCIDIPGWVPYTPRRIPQTTCYIRKCIPGVYVRVDVSADYGCTHMTIIIQHKRTAQQQYFFRHPPSHPTTARQFQPAPPPRFPNTPTYPPLKTTIRLPG